MEGFMLEGRDLTKKGAYFLSFFVVSLRGGGGFMMDAAVLRYHIGKGRKEILACVLVPLMGRFKGETGSRHHLQSVTNEKTSKLKVRWCLERFNNE